MRFVSLIFLFFILCPLGCADVKQTFNAIPERDREKIEFLLKFLIQRDTFGFVLFGENKCLTFTGIPLTHKEYFLPYRMDNSLRFQRNLKESWYVWKRYESRFKHPNILICENYQSIENEMHLQLFLFDKKKLKTTLEKYIEDFREVLGKDFLPDKFIASLEKKRKLIPLIKGDEKLLGILHGFGRDASTLFRDHVDDQTLDPPLEYLGKRPPGCLITPVSFRGYSTSEETKLLLEAYKKEILEIEEIFNSAHFIERTIEKFCAP
jgi:hypothetical protein